MQASICCFIEQTSTDIHRSNLGVPAIAASRCHGHMTLAIPFLKELTKATRRNAERGILPTQRSHLTRREPPRVPHETRLNCATRNASRRKPWMCWTRRHGRVATLSARVVPGRCSSVVTLSYGSSHVIRVWFRPSEMRRDPGNRKEAASWKQLVEHLCCNFCRTPPCCSLKPL